MKLYTEKEAVRLFKIEVLKKHRAIMDEHKKCSVFGDGHVVWSDELNPQPSRMHADSIFYYSEHYHIALPRELRKKLGLIKKIKTWWEEKHPKGWHESMLIWVDALQEVQLLDGGKVVGVYKFSSMFECIADDMKFGVATKEDYDTYKLKDIK